LHHRADVAAGEPGHVARHLVPLLRLVRSLQRFPQLRLPRRALGVLAGQEDGERGAAEAQIPAEARVREAMQHAGAPVERARDVGVLIQPGDLIGIAGDHQVDHARHTQAKAARGAEPLGGRRLDGHDIGSERNASARSDGRKK
jgi:hypothetical protein